MKNVKVSSFVQEKNEQQVSPGLMACNYYFDADFSYLEQLTSKDKTIIITDENVMLARPGLFTGWKTLLIKAGEENKQHQAIDYVMQQLIEMGADRDTFIIGVGGGVVTDITGFAASIYMRGLRLGFVPSSILGMVDASIGGKNGVDVGMYKNMVGLIRQPEFLLYDYSLLDTLPQEEWVNGFAEIIKHGCIKDANLFSFLEQHELEDFKTNKLLLAELIEKNVAIKTKVVLEDEFEQGDRKMLNFGHTIGHAIENLYQLPHGHAVSIGMVAACTFSEEINGFESEQKQRVINLIKKYQLPVNIEFDKLAMWELLLKDKKRVNDFMNFILLNKIGEAIIQPIPLVQLENMISQNL